MSEHCPADSARPGLLIGRASIAAAGTVYLQGISFATGMIVARVIGAADFGIFNLARNLLDITGIMTRLGLEVGLQRYFGETQAGGDPAARNLLLRRARLMADLVALLPPIGLALGAGGFLEASVYHYSGFGAILLCLALSLPFLTDIAVLGGAYRGILKLGPSVLAECVILPTVRLAIIVILFAAGWRLWAVVAGTTVGSCLASVFLAARARRDFGRAAHPTEQPWTTAFRVVRYSIVLAGALLVATLARSMDVLLLGHFATAQSLGQFSLVKTLLILMTVLGTAFGTGLGALIAERHARGDHAAMVNVISLVVRWVTLGTLPMLAIFLFWGAQLTPLFGASFHVPQGTVSWLAVGQFVFVILGPCGWALSMTGRHVLELKILASGLAISAVLCWLAIPAFGQIGAAVATCSTAFIVNGTRVLVVRRCIGAWPIDVDVFRITAAGLALAWICDAAVEELALSLVPDTVASIASFVLAYSIVAWAGFLQPSERTGIRDAVRSTAKTLSGSAN
jgi:O-antigen/teichoic acid export membrane protein